MGHIQTIIVILELELEEKIKFFINLPFISAHTVTFNALYTRSWYSCNTPLPLFIKTLGIRDGLVSSGFSGIPVMNLYK